MYFAHPRWILQWFLHRLMSYILFCPIICDSPGLLSIAEYFSALLPYLVPLLFSLRQHYFRGRPSGSTISSSPSFLPLFPPTLFAIPLSVFLGFSTSWRPEVAPLCCLFISFLLNTRVLPELRFRLGWSLSIAYPFSVLIVSWPIFRFACNSKNQTSLVSNSYIALGLPIILVLSRKSS